jgi:hypothetical protein
VDDTQDRKAKEHDESVSDPAIEDLEIAPDQAKDVVGGFQPVDGRVGKDKLGSPKPFDPVDS